MRVRLGIVHSTHCNLAVRAAEAEEVAGRAEEVAMGTQEAVTVERAYEAARAEAVAIAGEPVGQPVARRALLTEGTRDGAGTFPAHSCASGPVDSCQRNRKASLCNR